MNREYNNKNNTFPLGKQICFTIAWGCSESLPILIVGDEKLEKRKESRIQPNTRINTSWAVRTWSEWAVERNGMIAIKGGIYTENP